MTPDEILDQAGVPAAPVTPPPIERHRGQLRMAERLVNQHGQRLRYAHGLGWLQWDDHRWDRDRDGGPMRAAVSTVKQALTAAVTEMEGEARDDLLKDCRKSESSSGLEGMLRIAGSLRPVAVAADQLDRDENLFNAPNGTVDLDTGALLEHNPDHLITKVAGAAFDPSAHGPVFEKFIAEVLPDAEVRAFVQRLMGYAMLGSVREHILPIFTGTGKNGKTTLLEAVSKAFGDYAITAEPEMLIDRGNSHPTGQADLQSARLAVCSETDEGRALAAATVKRLTGGERVRARKMRQDFFEFDPSHTLILVTNHKPKVQGDDPALWRRIAVVPWDVVVARIDTRLPEKLASELPAILAWCYAGFCDYSERGGLDAPEAVTRRTAEYQASSDAMGRFLDERAMVNKNAFVKARELWAAWSQWAHAGGEPVGSEVTFAEAMARRGFEKKRTAAGQVYRGLGLYAAEDDPDD